MFPSLHETRTTFFGYTVVINCLCENFGGKMYAPVLSLYPIYTVFGIIVELHVIIIPQTCKRPMLLLLLLLFGGMFLVLGDNR